MQPNEPSAAPPAADYDPVADLYDRAFGDIRVRRDEWRWIDEQFAHLSAPPRVLDIGCGNGALLTALHPRLESGVGVDVSSRFIDIARERSRARPRLEFQIIADATLPFANDSFDVVTSFLSFRYLTWDAVIAEALRVLRPNGRILIVDMVAQQATPSDLWLLTRSFAKHLLRPLRDRRFHQDVTRLTSHPDWERMLRRNPIRPESEYRACFARWFPLRRIQVLNATYNKRVIAFDSGPVTKP